MADEYQTWDQTSSLYDPEALSSPNPDFEDLNGEFEAVDLGPPPPEFHPVLEGRLFTANDAIIGPDCEVHPTARLSYDSLPQEYRDVFKNCHMYLEKHLEFVKYLSHLSLNENEPSSERNLIKSLGIPVSTEEGDKKKWQCGVVGCEYKGTLQHLVSHLRTKSHIGIATFACTLDCKILFRHSQDRDRHVKEKICLKSRLVEELAEPQGSTRSLRGVQDQAAPATKPKIKSRANQILERGREYQNPAQTSAQGVNAPRTRNYDTRFQPLGNRGHFDSGIPSASFAPPQPLITPVHLTHAYNQTHSNVPTGQDGRVGMHPPSYPLLTPDLFRTSSILPTNYGGMHANVITNSNHNHNHNYGATDNFQPTNNPHFTPELQPVNPRFNNPTGLTYAYSDFDPRVNTGYQDPGQPSTSHSAHVAGDFYGGGPGQASHRRPRESRQPMPYVAQNQGRRNEGGGKPIKVTAHMDVIRPDPCCSIVNMLSVQRLTLYSQVYNTKNSHQSRGLSQVHGLAVATEDIHERTSQHWCRQVNSRQLEKFNQLRMLFANLKGLHMRGWRFTRWAMVDQALCFSREVRVF